MSDALRNAQTNEAILWRLANGRPHPDNSEVAGDPCRWPMYSINDVRAALAALQAPEPRPEFAEFVNTPSKRFLYRWGKSDGYQDGYADGLRAVKQGAPAAPADREGDAP